MYILVISFEYICQHKIFRIVVTKMMLVKTRRPANEYHSGKLNKTGALY